MGLPQAGELDTLGTMDRKELLESAASKKQNERLQAHYGRQNVSVEAPWRSSVCLSVTEQSVLKMRPRIQFSGELR